MMTTEKQSRKFRAPGLMILTALLTILSYSFSYNQTDAPVETCLLPGHIKAVLPQAPDTTKSKSSEDLFIIVEKMPQFPGSPQQWIAKNIRYPVEAMTKKIQGKVYVQFIVEKDGSVNEVKIIRSVHPLLDQEAMRVVKSMPKWKPGMQKGKIVRVSYTLPINFALSDPRPQSGFKPQTPEEKYTSYLKNIERIEQKIKNPSLLTESDKAPIGKRILGKETDNQKAYERMLKWANTSVAPSMFRIDYLMDSLDFTQAEKNTVTNIYKKYIQNNVKFIQSIGPDDFIQKFSTTPSFEYARLMMEAQIELKNSLSPERYKQLVLSTYLRSASRQDTFTVVEEMPRFTKGTVQNWISKNVKYPKSARKNKTEGRVFVQFIVEKDGQVSNAKILKGVSPELDQEALRLVNSMPAWTPGRQKGKSVRVAYTLPIYFNR